jgi:D-alanine-D-alanine ligase-like ATP-grasp enzyme
VLDLLGLRYGAFDLVYTPDGEYVFLEVNPNGQWYFMQLGIDLPLVETMAELLAGKTD